MYCFLYHLKSREINTPTANALIQKRLQRKSVAVPLLSNDSEFNDVCERTKLDPQHLVSSQNLDIPATSNPLLIHFWEKNNQLFF